MISLMEVVKWLQRESKNSITKYTATKTMIKELITYKAACIYLNSVYYNNTLNQDHCASTFIRHLCRNVRSFYTLHLHMDVNDIPYLKDRTPSQYVINYPSLRNLMPGVYKLSLNITIQHVHLRFNNSLSSTFAEFETDIDDIFDEMNAYIPQFTTRSYTPTPRKKRWIIRAALTVVYGLVSAYRFYKSYTFKKDVKRTLHYILDRQRHLCQDLLSNIKDVFSLAEITSSNFKDLRSDFKSLKSDTDMKFDTYLTNLMYTTADGVFYKNYLLYYVNILNRIDHNLVVHNNKVERIKTAILIKCRNFISGLPILASNKIPDSIVHADVLSNILYKNNNLYNRYSSFKELLCRHYSKTPIFGKWK